MSMATSEVIVGTCGFPASRSRVFSALDGAEVQESFYNLLGEKSIESLRNRPGGFHLTLKAWQATTHPYNSPTWRKMKARPPGDPTRYGWLRCTKENLWALEQTVQQALAVNAEVIVFQTPANMPLNDAQAAEVRRFLEHALGLAGGRALIAWEPRGEWARATQRLKEISDEGVIIITDYLRIPPLFPESPVGYTRLHGLGGLEVNYRYKYTDEDLRRLLGIVESLKSERVYVMFNNVYMLDDAVRFRSLIAR